jgi:hypothetical protein
VLTRFRKFSNFVKTKKKAKNLFVQTKLAMMLSFFLLLIFKSFWQVFFLLFGPVFSKSVQNLLNNEQHDKIVIVFPHSSKWESFWYLVYQASQGRKCCALCYYTYFDVPLLGRILRFSGMIPVRPARNGGVTGSTEKIIETLNNRALYPNGFVFFINPVGGIDADIWKSGYLAIAEGTKASIVLFGIDFSSHAAAFINQKFNTDQEGDEDEKKMMTFAMRKEKMDEQLMKPIQYLIATRPNSTFPPSRFFPGQERYVFPFELAGTTFVMGFLLPALWYWMWDETITSVSPSTLLIYVIMYGCILKCYQMMFICARQCKVQSVFPAYKVFENKESVFACCMLIEKLLVTCFIVILSWQPDWERLSACVVISLLDLYLTNQHVLFSKYQRVSFLLSQLHLMISVCLFQNFIYLLSVVFLVSVALESNVE